MQDIMLTAASMFILFYILKYDAVWFRYRVELTLAMFGVIYSPSKRVSFIAATVIFYVIYSVVFGR